MLEKVQRVAAFARQHHPSLGIVVDGGMDEDNIASAVEAGANIIVAGRGAFGGRNITENLERLRAAANYGPS